MENRNLVLTSPGQPTWPAFLDALGIYGISYPLLIWWMLSSVTSVAQQNTATVSYVAVAADQVMWQFPSISVTIILGCRASIQVNTTESIVTLTIKQNSALLPKPYAVSEL